MSGLNYFYLAVPYSHPDPATKQHRYEVSLRKQAELCLAGECIFSPIGHTHHLEQVTGPQPHEFWLALDRPMLRHASKLYVLMLDGWRESKGVREEIEIAMRCGIPVEYLEP